MMNTYNQPSDKELLHWHASFDISFEHSVKLYITDSACFDSTGEHCRHLQLSTAAYYWASQSMAAKVQGKLESTPLPPVDDL